MLRKLRPRSVYDVMAAIACFGVLAGGSAYAAATITGADVVNDSLTGEDVQGRGGSAPVNGSLTSADIGGQAANPAAGTPFIEGTLTQWDIKNGTLGTDDVANNSLTGADIDEGTLVGGPGSPSGPAGGDLTGSYPNPQIRSAASGSDDVNADKLDNLDSTQLSPATGDGRTTNLALSSEGAFHKVLSANITTQRSASLLVSAAVMLVGDEGVSSPPGRATCHLRFDDASRSVDYSTRISVTATLPVVWAHGVGAGAHTVELWCEDNGAGTVFIDNAGMNVSAHV